MILGILAVVHSTENLWPLHVFGPKTCPISKWDNIMQYLKTVFVRKNPKLPRINAFKKKIFMEIEFQSKPIFLMYIQRSV